MRNVTSLFTLLIVSSGLLTLAAPASAHESAYRNVAPYAGVRYDRRHYRPVYPHWLDSHGDFDRWYAGSRYRYQHHVRWERLFDLYRVENHHHRTIRARFISRNHYRHRHGHHRH
jgi:hypothetical protein